MTEEINVVQRDKANFLIAEEFQDFKEYIGYKLNLNSKEFEELYEEFIQWSNGDLTTKEIKPL